MSGLPAHVVRADAPLMPALARTRLGVTIATHGVVDYLAFTIVPLISVLEGHLNLTPGQGATLLALGSFSGGIVQPFVALFSDRFDTRLLGVLGLVLASLCIGAIGYIDSYTQLILIQILATAGIGAFHPVAAAAVGEIASKRRSLGIACFFLAGMCGAALGNAISPRWVEFMGRGDPARGLRSLVWMVIPGLLAASALLWAIRSSNHKHPDAHKHHAALDPAQRQARWLAVGILYITNVLRFVVNMMMLMLVARWAESLAMNLAGAEQLTQAIRTRASTINGLMQAMMVVGMGAGGISAGIVLKSHHEKLALMLAPISGGLGITAFSMADQIANAIHHPQLTMLIAGIAAILAGIGFGGIIPTTIALAQKLLPHRTSLASSLMMGGGWVIAASGPLLAEKLRATMGLTNAMLVTAALLTLSGVLAIGLSSRVLHESATDAPRT